MDNIFISIDLIPVFPIASYGNSDDIAWKPDRKPESAPQTSFNHTNRHINWPANTLELKENMGELDIFNKVNLHFNQNVKV